MIYFIVGGTHHTRLEKTKEILEKIGGDVSVQLREAEFVVREADYFIQAAGLFDGVTVLIYDGAAAIKENESAIQELFSKLTNAKNIFIFREEKISAPLETFFKKHPKNLITLKADNPKKSVYSNFAITDALLSRDKKQVWLLVADSWERGVSAEELSGMLLWQFRMLALAHKIKDKAVIEAEAGVSPFVLQKSKRAIEKFSYTDVLFFSKGLTDMYHQAHRGEVDFESAVESFLLKNL